jgi:hypothetical protein
MTRFSNSAQFHHNTADRLQQPMTDGELVDDATKDRSSVVLDAVKLGEDSTEARVNQIIGHAGLGKDLFKRKPTPGLQQTPIEVTEETRLNAARVTQSEEYALLERSVPRQDQYTLELEKLQQAAPNESLRLDAAAAQAAVEAAYSTTDERHTETLALEPPANTVTSDIVASAQPLSPNELEAQAAVEAAFADYVETGLDDLESFAQTATEQV